MKILPNFFKFGSFAFEMIRRFGDVAVMRKTKGRIVGYEVVIIQRHGDMEISGRQMAAAEYIPSSEQWGRLGWTFQKESDALDRFAILTRGKMGS